MRSVVCKVLGHHWFKVGGTAFGVLYQCSRCARCKFPHGEPLGPRN